MPFACSGALERNLGFETTFKMWIPEVVTVQMYYTTQDDCKDLKVKPFLPLKVTIIVDIRSRKFVKLTTFCYLYKNL